MPHERRFGFEVENKITKLADRQAEILPTLGKTLLTHGNEHRILQNTTISLEKIPPVPCVILYTFWGTFELVTAPFNGANTTIPLLDAGYNEIFHTIPHQYLPWKEVVTVDEGPPLRWGTIPIQQNACNMHLYKFDFSIELSPAEASIIRHESFLPFEATPLLINGVHILHAELSGDYSLEELRKLTTTHIQHVLDVIEN